MGWTNRKPLRESVQSLWKDKKVYGKAFHQRVFEEETGIKKLNERNLDGTGPNGEGPKTGRGSGKCKDDMDEATAQLTGTNKILRALGSDPVSGLGDLLGALGTVLEKAKGKLNNQEKKKVESELERLKREARERGNVLAAGDNEDVEDDEEEIEEQEDENTKWMITRDEKPVKKGFKTENDAYIALHNICPGSWHHAMKYEGYAIVPENE